MIRLVKIISLGSLPKLTLRQQSGKIRYLQLQCLTFPSTSDQHYLSSVLTLIPLLGKSLELQLNKDTSKGKLLDEGKSISMRLLKSGAANLNETQLKSTTLYKQEEVDEMKHGYREPEQVIDFIASQEKLQTTARALPVPLKCSVVYLKNTLFLIEGKHLIPIVSKHLNPVFTLVSEELVSEFFITHCTNIDIVLDEPFYDLATQTYQVEVALPLMAQLQLLRKGWASIRSEIRSSLDNDQFSLMLEATSIAKKEFRGLWKLCFDALVEKKYDEPFQAIVQEVIHGHQYKIRQIDGTILTIELERVTCPTHQENGAYQSSQFVRKTLIGKRIIVWLEKNSKLSSGFIKAMVALSIQLELVDKMLIEKGFATLRSTNKHDQHTAIFVNMEKQNKQDKVGIYSNDTGIFRFQDLTKLDRKAQRSLAKEFGQRIILEVPNNPYYAAVIESIREANLFKLVLPFHRAVIIVKLEGVEILNSTSKKQEYLLFKQNSSKFFTENFLQRDIEVRLSYFDDEQKAFIGTICLNKRNIVEDLLAEGLVYISDPELLSEYIQIQEVAQSKKIGIWNPELESILNEINKEEIQTFKAIISYVQKGQKIYYQKQEDTDILDNKIAPILQECNPKKMTPIVYKHHSQVKDTVLAPFQSDLYRACIVQDETVRKTREKELRDPKKDIVFFIDYGNYQVVNKKEIYHCDEAIAKIKPLANVAELSFTQPIQDKNEMSEQAVDYITDVLVNKGSEFIFVFKKIAGHISRRRMKLTLIFHKESVDIRKSLNFQFVAQGVLKIDRKNLDQLLRPDEKAELLRLETQAKKKAAYLWFQECENDPEGEQLMNMKGFNAAMRSNY